MSLSTSDWIAIIGIILATVIGLITWLKRDDGKSNEIQVKQSSGAFSKAKQKQNININLSDD